MSGKDKPDNLFNPDEEPCECAWHLGEKEVCSSHAVVKKIAEHLDLNEKNPEEIIESAKEEVGVDSERDLLEKLKHEIPEVRKDLQSNFKMEGPADSTDLFNNHHIDETLKAWTARWPDFQNINFHFLNFTDSDRYYNDVLSTYEYDLKDLDIEKLYKAGKRTIACVLNTDHYPGRGKHWICIFIDMRDDEWTIEYFNSSGNPPAYNNGQFLDWLVRMKNKMEKIAPSKKVELIYVCKVQLQYSNTECGPYCMYYIYNRLKGKSYKLFSHGNIPDEKVTKFRKHLFT